MKKPTPTQAARMWGVRTYGAWYWFTDPDNFCRAVERAYVAGHRAGVRRNSRRNGK